MTKLCSVRVMNFRENCKCLEYTHFKMQVPVILIVDISDMRKLALKLHAKGNKHLSNVTSVFQKENSEPKLKYESRKETDSLIYKEQ